MAPRRDNEELIKVVETHSVAGYPIEVPLFGAGKVVRQAGTRPYRGTEDQASPMPTFIVKLDHPMPFRNYAETKGLSTQPLTEAEWDEESDKRKKEGGALMLLGDEALERLKRGESVSDYEATYEAMADGGQLDGDGRVLFVSVFVEEVFISPDKLKTGMLVEVVGGPDFFGAGRVVGRGKNKDVILVEVFTPVSYFSATDALANEEVKPGFYSNNTYSIGYGTRQTMEDNGIPLPPGKFLDEGELDEEKREYILNDLLDIKFIDDLCRKYQPGKPHCLLQSLIFYIMPLHTKGRYAATFRPLPEKVITSDFVVSYG